MLFNQNVTTILKKNRNKRCEHKITVLHVTVSMEGYQKDRKLFVVYMYE